MAVAKRQAREKPRKIEQREVRGPAGGPQVGQTALLAGPTYRADLGRVQQFGWTLKLYVEWEKKSQKSKNCTIPFI